VAVTLTVKPRLTATVMPVQTIFEVRPGDRGRRKELPVIGQVASNHGWMVVLELPGRVSGPNGYSLDQRAIDLEPLPGLAGLRPRGGTIAVLAGRATPGTDFGNTLAIEVPPNAPAGVYELPIILSVTQAE